MIPTAPGGQEYSSVVGIRTHESDRLQWAVWSGDGPAELGAWIRVVDSSELGRLVVAPGKVTGVSSTESLPRVVALTVEDKPEHQVDGIEEPPPASGTSVWGRIGRPPHCGATLAPGTGGSAESTRYRELKAAVPPLGSRVSTPEGDGLVIASNVFTGTLTVRLAATSREVEITHLLPEGS
ncbi:MAG TPA: hypothetical protein VGR08_07585 [Thermomicrobiales bacterium]|nr:hypothetical protein [Thermomicrobiales bacterium]